MALAQQVLSTVDLTTGTCVHAKAMCKAIGEFPLISAAARM